MGLFMANLEEKKKNKKMESSSNNNNHASCSTKTERKIIEKNRRNQMKSLYSKLNSLIPNLNSKGTMPLPDRLDEAASYIKSLQENLEKAKEKKESLQMLARKRLNTYNITTTNNNDNMNSLKSPKIDIRVMGGSTLEIVFTSGTVHNNELTFYDIIRMLHEEMAEITNASFSVNANSIFLVVHAEIGEPESSLGAIRISEKLNKLVHGSCTEADDDLQPELWDLEIYSEILLNS